MSTITPEEASEAISRVLDGDKDAFATIVHGYHHYVRSALAGYCRSAEEVEEFAHLAFVECFVHLEKYDPKRGPFHWWLLTIARSRLLDELRRRKAQGRRQLQYLELSAARECVPDGFDRKQSVLGDCMDELPQKEAELVRARYEDNRTSDSIASSLGKSAVAVRRSLQRVRERLRRCMEQHLNTSAEGAA